MVNLKFSPLGSAFTIFSMLGFVVSVLFVSKYSLDYGFTFAVIFFCMFIASMQAMRHANPDAELQMR